ncbi:MAG: hypothetical protein M3Z08_17605, partial [Chloroflexota bacterium]|nr:hypothetical protein [Chloroflexota bacterium]
PVLSRIRLQELDQTVQAALTIAGGVLGDLSVFSELAALFRQGEVPEGFSRPVAAFLVQHMSPAELLAILRDAHCDLDARTRLAEALGNTDKIALVPDLLAILRARVIIEMVRVAIADAVGMLGETPETARELLDLLRASEIADRLHQTAVPDAIYRALWSVSRRAGVMVVETRPGSKIYRVVPR